MTAKTEKPVLGVIDCPHCGQVGAMEIKHDKNSEPFGHCDECAGQLRVGGKAGRVRKFCKRYPWAAASSAPVTVTVTEEIALPGPAPVAAPVARPAARKPTWADALAGLAGGVPA